MPKSRDKNILFLYSSEEKLARAIAILSLFHMNQTLEPLTSKVLIISRRNIQKEIQVSLSKILDSRITILNGSILPQARLNDYERYPIILATPKTVKNDLKEKMIPNKKFSLLLILNAEMGASSRSLRYITQKMGEIRLCAFSNIYSSEKIRALCENLLLQEVVELENINSSNRENVLRYSLPLPEQYIFILDILNQIKSFEIKQLQNKGFILTNKCTFREIVAIHESLKTESRSGELLIQTGNLQRIFTLQKIIVSQGFRAALNYLNELDIRRKDKGEFIGRRAIEIFLSDPKIKKIFQYIELYEDLNHPKSQFLLKLLSNFRSGVSLVTHNFENSVFLKDLLIENCYSVIHFKQPISSIPRLELDKRLQHFKLRNSHVCISNTINDIIEDYAEVIIAYDVNAENVDKLNKVKRPIPRVFLLSKQTNEESRFFYLKNIGKRDYLKANEIEKINETLIPLPSNIGTSEPLNQTSDSIIYLHFSPTFFENDFPSLFPEKDFKINFDNSMKFPGIRLGSSIFFLIVSEDTLGDLFDFDLKTTFNYLLEDHTKVYCLIFPNSIASASLKFRRHFFHLTSKLGVSVIILNSINEIPSIISDISLDLSESPD
ncbi:MAG: hypothetical protein EAX86_05790 [Candidatus Heimdallarchaeota archaeon]|nr:hypothetical protein [Candidatus Heimdallarchaeota archaeon]